MQYHIYMGVMQYVLEGYAIPHIYGCYAICIGGLCNTTYIWVLCNMYWRVMQYHIYMGVMQYVLEGYAIPHIYGCYAICIGGLCNSEISMCGTVCLITYIHIRMYMYTHSPPAAPDV